MVVSSEEDSPTAECSEEDFELPNFEPFVQGPLSLQKDKGKAVDQRYHPSWKGFALDGPLPSSAVVIREGPSILNIPVVGHRYPLPPPSRPSSSASSSFLDIPFDPEESGRWTSLDDNSRLREMRRKSSQVFLVLIPFLFYEPWPSFYFKLPGISADPSWHS